ncbi:MAG: DUF1513 domain-containing protein [Litoreibacter sp.]
MTTRRAFLAGLLAAGSTPQLGWADAGAPSHLSAAMTAHGHYVLVGLRRDGSIAFRIPLPARGHAATAHPERPEAVAFARRPGTYAIVIDCVSGGQLDHIQAPEGRHFYGHGAFSKDGHRLYTTENHIETGEGRIGIWSRADGYSRIGDMASGGIGPHEMLRLPGTNMLAVANGGILTRPESGREKLNLETMRPNLTLVSEDGELIDIAELPKELHQNSLRHIASGPNGQIACAFQWQGDIYEAPSLLANYIPGHGLDLLETPEQNIRALNGYGGSVAADTHGSIVLTSPRGGVVQTYDAKSGFLNQTRRADICGVSVSGSNVMATDGTGGVHLVGATLQTLAQYDLAFDNHLISIQT